MNTDLTTENNHHWKRPFFTIWSGQALSLFGSQLVQFALIWYITDSTGSATALSIGSLVGLLPQVFLSPFIGVLVDRWNRRRIMIVADIFIALVTLVLALLFAMHVIKLWHIYLIMFIRAVGGGFHRPAMTASTSLMVPKEHLTRVQGLNQMLNGGLNIVSAPLGALLIKLISTQGIIAIDVVTALIAVLPLTFIAIPQPKPTSESLAHKLSMFAEMKEGFQYVLGWRGLLIISGIATLLNFLLSPAFSLLPILVTGHFQGDVIDLGWVEFAFGVGVVSGGLGLSAWGGFKRRILTSILGIMGIGLGTLTLGMIPGEYLSIAMAATLFVGLAQPITNGSLGAIMQAVVDPAKQGRVFTMATSLAAAMTPVGLIIAGPVSDRFGVQTWFIVGGISCLIMAFLMFLTPSVMNIEGLPQKQEGTSQPTAPEE
jgi:DHA3 family macrolide efflux protein-like MFS transporter